MHRVLPRIGKKLNFCYKECYNINYGRRKMLPNELIDKILIKLNNQNIAIKLKRDFVINKLHEINHYTILNMSMEGNLDVIKWLYKNGDKNCPYAINGACIYGHIDVIKWLYNNGFKLTNIAIGNATLGGHVDVLKYLQSIGAKCEASHFSVANKITN